MSYKILVSNGEILDKYSILSIKHKYIKNKDQLKNINKELSILKKLKQKICVNKQTNQLYKKLYNINHKLWNIENQIRNKEKQQIFDKTFIRLARNVYINNDKRAHIKYQINKLSNSILKEEKSYSKY